MEWRTKEVESFRHKLGRKGDRYGEPLRDITDLSAVRIITYYQEDVALIGNLIGKEFEVDTDNSIDKSVELAPDQFGYVSVHYVASLLKARSRLSEWSAFKSMKVEIQVRTALQHAWAAVNHKLDYKSADEAPTAIQRRLFRLSALFELADEQLSDIRDARLRISEEYESEVHDGKFDIPLDLTSLRVYFTAHPYPREVLAKANEIMPGVVGPTEPHPERSRDLKDLLRVLKHFGIETVGEFDALLRKMISKGDRWKRLPPDDPQNNPETTRTLEDMITVWVLIEKQADQELYSSMYPSDRWGEFVDSINYYHASS